MQFSVFVLSLLTALTCAAANTVTLDYSTVVPAAGNDSLGYYKYQNIRYAAVPTGDLRWAKPQWPPIETEINNGSLATSDVDCSYTEDCLYLDVWAPAHSQGKKLPVLVWTYGGGFAAGSKSQNTPEGLFNLTKDFIFVAYNYRLGMTGIANGPTLLHEGGTSNTGLWDAEHAFRWVHKYISGFGGDPEQITAFGFSAGASVTLFQITRFAGHNDQLFSRAYITSPGFVPGAGHEHAEAFWQNVSTTVGCPGGHLDCMRNVNFTSLNTAADAIKNNYTYQFQPRVDGDFIADTYETQFYQNRFNFAGPMVLSHELHEANGQGWEGVNTTEDVSTYLKIFFPSITPKVIQKALDLYPESDYSSPGLRFSDMKQAFDLTAHNLAVTHALNNKTWNAVVELGQASHGADQPYYWYSTYTLSSSGSQSGMQSGSGATSATNSTSGPASNSSGSGPTGAGGAGGGGGGSSVNSTTAIQMQKYLLSFVLTGDPNTVWPNEKLYWPLYGYGTQLVINDTFSLAPDDLANEKSMFWNQALWY